MMNIHFFYLSSNDIHLFTRSIALLQIPGTWIANTVMCFLHPAISLWVLLYLLHALQWGVGGKSIKWSSRKKRAHHRHNEFQIEMWHSNLYLSSGTIKPTDAEFRIVFHFLLIHPPPTHLFHMECLSTRWNNNSRVLSPANNCAMLRGGDMVGQLKFHSTHYTHSIIYCWLCTGRNMRGINYFAWKWHSCK